MTHEALGTNRAPAAGQVLPTADAYYKPVATEGTAMPDPAHAPDETTTPDGTPALEGTSAPNEEARGDALRFHVAPPERPVEILHRLGPAPSWSRPARLHEFLAAALEAASRIAVSRAPGHSGRARRRPARKEKA